MKLISYEPLGWLGVSFTLSMGLVMEQLSFSGRCVFFTCRKMITENKGFSILGEGGGVLALRMSCFLCKLRFFFC